MDETTRNEHTLKAVGSVEGPGLGRTGGDLGEEVIQMGKVTKIGQELAKRNSAQGCYSFLLEFYCRFFLKNLILERKVKGSCFVFRTIEKFNP